MTSYTLEITVDGKPATFKQAAESVEDARQKCVEYFHDSTLPKTLHKNVMVLACVPAKWQPEGFAK
jgi:hypothetical protein